MEERTPDQTSPRRAEPDDTQHAWTLAAAAGLGAIEATLLIAVILFMGDRLPSWALFMAVKYLFCVQLLRRRPGAFFAMLLWEMWGVTLAVVAPGVPIALRAIELALAATVLALLVASSRLFPSARLPGPSA